MGLEEKKHTIFVGNAPMTATKKQMKKLFSKFGAIESVRLRSLVAADEKTSKKVAALKNEFSSKMQSLHFYVKFKDEASVKEALKMNGEKLEGHMLRVDSCIGRKDYDANVTVFVGNLPPDVKEDDLAKHFEQAGEVNFVRVVRDPSTGSGKGFAFVGFKDGCAVPIALKLDGSSFHKRNLRVKSVEKRKKRLVNSKPSVGFAKKKVSNTIKVRTDKVLASKHKVFSSEDEGNSGSLKKAVRKLIKKRRSRKTKKSIMS